MTDSNSPIFDEFKKLTDEAPKVGASNSNDLLCVDELKKALELMLVLSKHSMYCKRINGHPRPELSRCICHIGKVKRALKIKV